MIKSDQITKSYQWLQMLVAWSEATAMMGELQRTSRMRRSSGQECLQCNRYYKKQRMGRKSNKKGDFKNTSSGRLNQGLGETTTIEKKLSSILVLPQITTFHQGGWFGLFGRERERDLLRLRLSDPNTLTIWSAVYVEHRRTRCLKEKVEVPFNKLNFKKK